MLVAARISGFLLLFVFVTATLSIAYLVQGGDEYAAGKCNLVVLKRKTLQIIGKKEINWGRKIGVRARNPRKSRIFRENYEARFVAYNADYRGPRHHPPKNN